MLPHTSDPLPGVDHTTRRCPRALQLVLLLCIGCGSTTTQVAAADPVDSAVQLLQFSLKTSPQTAQQCLRLISKKIHNGELKPARVEKLREKVQPMLRAFVDDAKHQLHADAAILACSWSDPAATTAAKRIALDPKTDTTLRVLSLESLRVSSPSYVAILRELLATEQDIVVLALALESCSRCESDELGRMLVDVYPRLADPLKPKAIQLLTQRGSWSRSLFAAIRDQTIDSAVVNINQVRQLSRSPDQQVRTQAQSIWGTVRTERNPERELVIDRMRKLMLSRPGDAGKGRPVFAKVCGQCHKIYGEGQEVGPDITVNGRASFEQLLSNVFDPSLVIGPAYQARQAITVDGRVISGLVIEDSPRRVILKVQGGKQEILPRNEIDEIEVSRLSLMPEGLETQISETELVDLFAFMLLDKDPRDPKAEPISGAPVWKK